MSVAAEALGGKNMGISLPWKAPRFGVDFPRLLTVHEICKSGKSDIVGGVHQLQVFWVLDVCLRKSRRRLSSARSLPKAAMRLNSGLFKRLVRVQIFYLRYTRQLIGVAGAKRRSLNVALVWLQLIEQRRSDVRVLDPADIRLQPGRSDGGLPSPGN